MAAFDPYPYTPTSFLADLEIERIDRYYDGTVVIRARERPRFNETAIYTARVSLTLGPIYRSGYDRRDLYPPYQPPRRSRFKTRFPGEVRAEMPTQRPVQAPRAMPAPVKRLHHFASPKVWARRNKPTPPQGRRELP